MPISENTPNPPRISSVQRCESSLIQDEKKTWFKENSVRVCPSDVDVAVTDLRMYKWITFP